MTKYRIQEYWWCGERAWRAQKREFFLWNTVQNTATDKSAEDCE